MGLRLSDRDQRLLKKASEIILTPGSYAGEDHWHHAVIGELMELTGASMSAIRVAQPIGFRMTALGFEEEAIEAHKSYYHKFDFGHALGENPILGEVFSRNEYYGDRLPEFRRTEYYADYITKYSAFDALCLSTRAHEHHKGIVVYLWYEKEMPSDRRRTGLAMLRLLAPSFRAGMTIGAQVHRHRKNLLATFEACSDGCAVFSQEGILLHRNPALGRILAQTESHRELFDAILKSVNAIREAHVRNRGFAESIAHISAMYRFGSEEYAIAACVLELESATGASILVTVTPRGARNLHGDDIQRIRDAFGLTQRELEVVVLLRSRHTNQEIAQRLGISEHTARHHTENVLRKVGAATRNDVARAVSR